MKRLGTPDEARTFAMALAREGKTLALVPTMGFLHEGHLSLMREGKRRADVVVATIFVNPSQFSPQEDLTRYPRDLEGDLKKCESAGCAAVYTPEPQQVYPPGFQTWVNVENVSQGLCGDRRPGHFRGVATIVAKLLAVFRPTVALFGEKDYQQLQVISALAFDLDLGVQIVGHPTIREADGLAMSSRNSYLSLEDRKRALALSQGLFAARRLVEQGESAVEPLLKVMRDALAAHSVREDYVAVCDAVTLAPLSVLHPVQKARALVAAFVGNTRLIDNVALN